MDTKQTQTAIKRQDPLTVTAKTPINQIRTESPQNTLSNNYTTLLPLPTPLSQYLTD